MRTARVLMVSALILVVAIPLHAAVHITRMDPKATTMPEGERVETQVVYANENVHYALNYDVIHDEDTPGEVTSHWWAWQGGTITLGMVEPASENWYRQGFINWTFDDESLHTRPAEITVIRDGGQDGMVEYLWDTPTVRASLRFALATGSDKLLMFASYEPKQPIESASMTLTCYPATFAEPRNRRVTTALGTREPGDRIELDMERERWVLYEDVTEGRPGMGSAGLFIGTPDAFESVTIPVGSYGIETRLALPPEGGEFALGFYENPLFADYEETREYFGRTGHAEAEQLEQMAAGDLDRPLPPMPLDAQRVAMMESQAGTLLDRPAELWTPNPEPLDFPWAASIPGEPIRTTLFTRRWAAWDTMELARRLEMDVAHMYFDTDIRISDSGRWPYATATGIGPLPEGIAARKAIEIADDASRELFVVADVTGTAVPGVARTAILGHVAAGSGLMLVGDEDVLSDWPEEMFSSEDPGLAEIILRSFPQWDQIPGYRAEDRGALAAEPPIRTWRHGEGRVVHLNVNLFRRSALVPRTGIAEGLEAAADRCLAIAARAAMAAAGREMAPARGAAETLLVRLQDDLGRVLALNEQPAGAALILPGVPAGRSAFVDVIGRNAAGETIYLESGTADAAGAQTLDAGAITAVSIESATITHEPAPPWVDMPGGGEIQCVATVANVSEGAQIRWTVRDIHDRLLAQAITPAQADASVTLDLPRPMTVAHVLDVAVLDGEEEVAFERQRFTMTVPYPLDDYTGLMWTYAGGDPVIQQTDRLCYEMGAEMCDLSHMGGYSDAGAAREYSLTSRTGLRVVPYVTRIAGRATPENHRAPCLHSPEYIESERQKLTATTRQAAPYSPVAYTVGDENYLFRGTGETCHTEWSIAAYREWLEARYESIDALNEQWATGYASFAEIEPMLLETAAEQTESFAPWIDHKLFMDTTFADAHEMAAEFIRAQDPGAKVGWDGFLGYTWRSGYDFAKLTRNLELNQTYTMHFIQGEFYRSFKRDDAVTGKWGNRIADDEAGWSAFPWDGVLAGDNSVWWWTSWGVDYTPFNPDLSINNFGKWYFESLEETRTGPGKLLLDAGREHSPIAVLYSHRDLFAAAIFGQITDDQSYATDSRFLNEHEAILRALRDAGYQYTHLTFEDVVDGRLSPSDHRVFVLPYASCVSDEMAERLQEYVEAGGTLVANGRAGLLGDQGRVRDDRPLDELLGVRSPAGMEAIVAPTSSVTAALSGSIGEVAVDLPAAAFDLLEPGMTVTGGAALAEVGESALAVVNEVGAGRTVLLNFALRPFNAQRTEEGVKPLQEVLVAAVEAADVHPPASITRADGSLPLCLQTVQFGSGPLQYLAVMHDILVRALGDQEITISLDRPAAVYDIRAGEQIGEGRVSEWQATIDRGYPLVYALLPYEITGVEADAPAAAGIGDTVEVATSVAATAPPATHVVRMDVYAPGNDTAHRQYSQNILCERGEGVASIPFALSDAAGAWRIELRDVASGRSTTHTLTLQ